MAHTPAISIIDAAWERSVKNRSSLAEDDPELLNVLHEAMEGYYDDAARMTSTVFSVDSHPLTGGPIGWTVPEDVNRIYSVRKTSGQKVYILPPHKKFQALGAPAVYRDFLGLYPIGLNPNPNTEQLRVNYSKRPYRPTIRDNIDYSWPDQYNDLLVTRVAQYLAKKSTERGDELAILAEEQKEGEARLYAYFAQSTLFDVGLYGKAAQAAEPMRTT